VVTIHPVTGRRILFVSRTHTSRIVDLTPAESRVMLDMIYAHNSSPDFAIRWSWQVGDIAFWDNRAVQHHAVGDYTERRVMHRLSLRGDRPRGLVSTPAVVAAGVG
jgi:taurine dioxygenase